MRPPSPHDPFVDDLNPGISLTAKGMACTLHDSSLSLSWSLPALMPLQMHSGASRAALVTQSQRWPNLCLAAPSRIWPTRWRTWRRHASVARRQRATHSRRRTRPSALGWPSSSEARASRDSRVFQHAIAFGFGVGASSQHGTCRDMRQAVQGLNRVLNSGYGTSSIIDGN